MADYIHSAKFKEISEKIKDTENIKDVEIIKGKLQGIEQDAEVTELLDICDKRIEEIKLLILEQKYQDAISQIEKDNSDYTSLIETFKSFGDYKDTAKYVGKLENAQREAKREKDYKDAIATLSSDNPDWKKLRNTFENLGDFKNSKKHYELCSKKYNEKNAKRRKLIILIGGIIVAVLLIVLLVINFTSWEGSIDGHKRPLFGGIANHTYELISYTPPTCSEKGVLIYRCSVCNYEKTEYEEELPHTVVVTVTKEPNCTEEGIKEYYCTVCGELTKTESISAIGHIYDEGKVTKEPTCTEEGIKEYHCTECGVLLKSESVSALGHMFDNGTIVTAPTCTSRGVANYTCMVCGHRETRVLDALGHDWRESNRKDSTCIEEGYIEYKCSRCGETRKEVIEKKEHNYKLIETIAPTCIKEGVKHYQCSDCGEEKQEHIEATGHAFIDGYCTICELDYHNYSIGSLGQAGGYVFYDCDADNESGNKDGLISSECGWRFLEAAPSDMSKEFVWGDSGLIGTDTRIGTGKENTGKISETRGGKITAAKACLDYSFNGFDDYFLPSKGELNLMYKNLKQNSLGCFSDHYYWSSSEWNNGSSDSYLYDAWSQNFRTGNQYDDGRSKSLYVRAIRAF